MNKIIIVSILLGVFGWSWAIPLTYNVTIDGLDKEHTLPLIQSKDGTTLYYFNGIYSGTRDQADIFCNLLGMRLLSIQSKELQAELAGHVKEFLIYKKTGNIWTSGKLVGDDSWVWESTGKIISSDVFLPPSGSTDKLLIAAYDRKDATPTLKLLATADETQTGYAICQAPK